MKTLNPCTWVRRVRYPQTTEGRKKFIKDSLKTLNFKIIIGYCLVILIGLAGMIVTLVWVINGSENLLLLPLALLSLLIIIQAFVCIRNERRSK